MEEIAKTQPATPAGKLPVSVIVAARNEEKNLPRCLQALRNVGEFYGSPGILSFRYNLRSVNCFVTMIAKGNQVVFRIGAQVTPELPVVDLKLLHCATALAPPTIALEDPLAQLLVGIWI